MKKLLIIALLIVGCATINLEQLPLEEIKNAKEPTESIWSMSHYVDEFGDYGDVGYIKGSAKGYFSNSATY